MKRTPLRTSKGRVAWSDLGYAALQGNFADTFDDRVSESLVDYEDEREAIEVVVQSMNRTVN
ncbi:MAG TPA: hypothetical protein VGQ88_03570 [Burkholderiales bacterium]|nr:hypothetical protein [Burkholderiales bacterium]